MLKEVLKFAFTVLVPITFLFAQEVTINNPLFSDHKARKVGDIITVEIIEFTETQNESNNEIVSNSEKSLGLGASLPDLTGIGLGAAFSGQGSFSGNTGDKFSGGGKSSNKGSLKAKMTVFITKELGDGLLQIEGTRDVVINGDIQTMKLEGTVRERDISSENSVPSYKVANAKITYSGKGPATSAYKPGFFTRLFNWMF